MVMLRAVPSFEAFGRFLEASNPVLAWTRMMGRYGRHGCVGSPQSSPRAPDHRPCRILTLLKAETSHSSTGTRAEGEASPDHQQVRGKRRFQR